jgi:hypothetical protein
VGRRARRHLRLLYGTRLEAGRGFLRAGSSHLATLDLASGEPVDADLVRRLIAEAVGRHEAFASGADDDRGPSRG